MSRQAQNITARRNFWLYIDEFANFITPSMAEILSGARKYRIGLTLAHQELHQLQRNPEVASAVMTHPYTRIVFRVGDDDARKLADGFSYFEAKDLRNLETGQAICRVERSDYDFNLTVPLPEVLDETETNDRRQDVITVSREKYGTARAEVDALLAKSRAQSFEDKPSVAPPTPASPVAPAPQAVEVAPPSPPHSVQPIAESKSLDLPAVSDIPVPALRKGVVEEAIPLPPLLTPKAPEAVHSPSPRDLGRGGAQHQAIQKRIKEAAEALGFRSVIEKPVLDGQGSVDLWLERTGQTIACEISISTTIDHEVKNVRKCLKAGVPNVAVICLDEERLQKIANAVAGSLGAELA
ncbi:MAG: TraM recognition domain-containing protein, partial [Patescibacteria group bacterium]|nr:TraM recognition domain-containing protein [Patescibacteria group bacterium]